MTRVMMVYASLTGNTRAGAEILEDAFSSLDVEVDTFESYMADPFDFEDYDICVVGSYTYGVNGDLPDEIIDFYEELEDVSLEDKIYGVFGSGDVFYVGQYCLAVDYFEEQFELTGAKQGAESVKYNLDPVEDDKENLENFAEELIETHKKMD